MSESLDVLLRTALPWLSAEVALRIARQFVRREWGKDSSLLQQGELFTQVLLVETGTLRLFFTQEDGREFNKNFFAEGRLVLPVTGRMATAPSLFGIAALEHAVVWAAPVATFKKTLVDTDCWHTIQRKLLAGMVNEKLQREHDLLALSGSERYGKFCLEHPQLSQRIPVGQLASFLGLTSVSLSRIRSTSRKLTACVPQRTA